MEDRAISLNAVIDVMHEMWGDNGELLDAIKELPPVTPQFYPPCEDCNKKMNEIRKAYDKLQDRPKGHWIDRGMDGDWAWRADGRGACWYNWECSVCHKICIMKQDICQCGADMRGDDNENSDN